MAGPLYGRENMAAFFAALVTARGSGTPIKIHVVGDSKAGGTGTTDGYRIDQLLTNSLHGYPVQITYEGFGGQNSYLWANGEAADFVSQHPDTDLLIVNFGTNESVVSATGGVQTLAQTEANHFAAIGTIRASISEANMSILILGQPPCNNWASGYDQTTANMVNVNAVLRDVAEQSDAAFFDPMELFTRAHATAGWMDQLPTPTYGDGNVHPGNAMNLVMVGELARSLFPMGYKSTAGGNGLSYPTLANGWLEWTTGYSPRATLRDGEVMLDGLIKPGTTAAYTTLFTLAAGYRPPANRFFNCSTGNSGATCDVQVLANGVVRLGAAFTGTYISLDAIRFLNH